MDAWENLNTLLTKKSLNVSLTSTTLFNSPLTTLSGLPAFGVTCSWEPNMTAWSNLTARQSRSESHAQVQEGGQAFYQQERRRPQPSHLLFWTITCFAVSKTLILLAICLMYCRSTVLNDTGFDTSEHNDHEFPMTSQMLCKLLPPPAQK